MRAPPRLAHARDLSLSPETPEVTFSLSKIPLVLNSDLNLYILYLPGCIMCRLFSRNFEVTFSPVTRKLLYVLAFKWYHHWETLSIRRCLHVVWWKILEMLWSWFETE